MSKQVYISADYDQNNGDQAVVEELTKWGSDNLHKVDFIDMSKVSSGSVTKSSDCRICDLKAEFNRQINASSAVIFVVGDMTGSRTAGSGCERVSKAQSQCYCTPYKQNTNGSKACKVSSTSTPDENGDFGSINALIFTMNLNRQKRRKRRSSSSIIPHEKKQTGSPLT